MKERFTADKAEKLTDALHSRFPLVARAFLKEQCKRGEVRVNGRKTKEDVLLSCGDAVEIFLPADRQNATLPVVYEDDEVILVDKPPHIESDTQVPAVVLQERGIQTYAVHRLDANTTGILILAKTQAAYDALVQAFRDGQVHKTYAARVFGCPEADEGVWTAYLQKDAQAAYCTVSSSPQKGSREIVTRFRVLSRGTQSVLLLCPETGRTHQLRAHAAFMGVPIVGDDKYGDRGRNRDVGARRQMLRAVEISFGDLRSPVSHLSGRTFSVQTGQDIEGGTQKGRAEH